MDVDRGAVKRDVEPDSDVDSDTVAVDVLLPVVIIGPAVWSISVEAGKGIWRPLGAEPAINSIEVEAVGALP